MQHFFNGRAAFDVLLEYQDPVVAAEIHGALKQAEALRLKQRGHCVLLVETDFQAYYTVRLKMAAGVLCDGTVNIKPVISAIQGGSRIMISYLRLKLTDDTGPDIRRI